MAITKILHQKEVKKYAPKHLKAAISYILDKKKTQGQLLMGSNCGVDEESIFKSFIETKKQMGKEKGRQGYHFIISFDKGEATPETAHKIVEEFTEKYLGDHYDYVYATHTDKEHTHCHLIFNSVSRVDGLKYHYKKGDWEKWIQPITNEICKKYGLSEILLENEKKGEKEKKGKKNLTYNKWLENKKYTRKELENIIWLDIKEAAHRSVTYEQLLMLLKNEFHYELKDGKSLSLKGQYQSNFMRFQKDDIVKELNKNEKIAPAFSPKLKEGQRCQLLERKPMSKFQRKQVRRLYRLHNLRTPKRKRYKNAWQYTPDILKLKQLKEQVRYVMKTGIYNRESLEEKAERIKLLKRQNQMMQSQIYRQKNEMQPLFMLLTEYESLQEGAELFELGHEEFKNDVSRRKEIEELIDVGKTRQMREFCETKLMKLKKDRGKLWYEEKMIKRIKESAEKEVPQRDEKIEVEKEKNKGKQLR